MKRRLGKRESEKQPEAPSLSHPIQNRIREAVFLLVTALSLFILVALFSYSQADPSWSHYVATHHIHNAAGRAGAWMADFALYLCGYLAYVFPFLLMYAGWVYWRYRKQEGQDLHYPMMILRIAGFVLIMLSGAALASLYVSAGLTILPNDSGGIIGAVIAWNMVEAFNRPGTGILLSALLLIGVTLFTGFSWLQLTETIGRQVLRFSKYAHTKIRSGDWHIALGQWIERRQKTLPQEQDNYQDAVEDQQTPQLLDEQIPLSLHEKVARKLPKISRVKSAGVKDEPEVDSNAKKQPTTKPAKRSRRHARTGSMPKLSLLDAVKKNPALQVSNAELQERSMLVEAKLRDFGVTANVVAVHPGPVVTRFELQLAAGTKVSKITALAKDLARSLSVISVRVVEVIPGKSVIGLELPNESREMVSLQEVLASKQYKQSESSLTLGLGKDIAGISVAVDLAKMPHLLVAGTTGSGKSVCLNAMLLSLLYKSTPEQLRMILIDPKMLELSIYDGIPHLLVPVVTDMKDAATALRWCVAEMERRYRLMAALGVRNVSGFNQKIRDAQAAGNPILDPFHDKNSEQDAEPLTTLPKIVVLADEFADMMVVVGKKVETLIARLAQKARAAGIHLILATQRPSVDVITGLIKANIPTRIAFQVSSKVDSRTIIDQQGAEQLLGHGDMLYLPPGSGVPMRVHGAYVSDDEVHRVVNHLKETSETQYMEEILDPSSDQSSGDPVIDAAFSDGGDAEKDEFYDQAVYMVTKARRVSVSSIQRRFKIGYNRASRIVEAMEAAGVVSSMESNGLREVLAPPPREE